LLERRFPTVKLPTSSDGKLLWIPASGATSGRVDYFILQGATRKKKYFAWQSEDCHTSVIAHYSGFVNTSFQKKFVGGNFPAPLNSQFREKAFRGQLQTGGFHVQQNPAALDLLSFLYRRYD
jgi:hypothetical protein